MHQGFNAFVGVAEPGFQAHNGFAVGMKAEMSRLDDTSMDGADGNLVNAFPLGR